MDPFIGVPSILLVLGLIILLGFLSSLFFERTKISDILLLMLAGFIAGPVAGLVSPEDFLSFAPFVGALALIIVLMDGGLNLNLFEVLTGLSRAASFTVVVFLLSAAFCSALLYFVFNWPLLHALLLSAVLGGTSSNIVISLVSKLDASEKTKIILSLESILTDVLCIVFGLALVQVIASNTVDLSAASHSVASAFSIAAVVGALMGIFWMGFIRQLYGKPFSYFVTLAVVFIIYALVEALGGSGAIAVLTFALVLGSSKQLAELFKWKGDYSLDFSIKTVQDEISFFVKTFFFVYLGLLFQIKYFTVPVLLASLGLLAAIFAARAIGVYALAAFDSDAKREKSLLIAMMPRGLAAAVLAFLPLQAGVNVPNFVEITFLVLFLTNLVSTIGVFLYSRKALPRAAAPAAAELKKPRVVR